MADKPSSGTTAGQDLLMFLGVLVLIFIVWVFTGGPDRYISHQGPFLNPPAPIGSGDAYYISGAQRWSLGPWITARTGSGIGIGGTAGASGGSAANQLSQLQNQADLLTNEVASSIEFGTPSPYRGQVVFENTTGGAKLGSNKTEYVVIRAQSNNAASVPITGWKLVSGIANKDGTLREAYIPNASPVPETGEVNPVYGVSLAPGDRAYVVTGGSPLGVSFRVNTCSGYLEQFQDFSPQLNQACPSPRSELKFAEQTIPYQYNCEEYVSTLNYCQIVLKPVPDKYGSECAQFVKNQLTYNACVDNHRNRPGFYTNEWRLFLDKSIELWRNDRDIIKLLDAQGRTVDLLKY